MREPAHKPADPHSRSPWPAYEAVLSSLVGIGAGVFTMLQLANNIRRKFFQNFVLGYGESPTVFDTIVKTYSGNDGAFAKLTQAQKARESAFASGELSQEQFQKQSVDFMRAMRDTATEYREAIDAKLLHDFNIPTKGPTGWLEGTYKRWKNMGMTSRRDTAITFASVSAMAVGTLLLLRHNKTALSRIEDRLDDIEAQKSGRG